MKNIIIALILSILNFYKISFTNLGEIFLLLYMLYIIISKKKIIIEKNKFMNLFYLSIIFIIIYVLINCLVGKIFISQSLKITFKFISILLTALFVFYSLNINKKIVSQTICLYIMFVYIFDLLYYLSNNYSIRYVLHTFPILLITILYYFSFNKKNKIFSLIFIILNCLVVSVGDSRTTLVILVVIFLYFLLRKIKHSKMNVIKKILIMILLILFTFFSWNYLKKEVSHSSASNNERKMLLTIAYDGFKSNIFIGIGPGNFPEYANKYISKPNITPHNYFIEILSEYGMIGFLTLFSPLIYYLFSLNSCKSNKLTIILFIYLIVYFMFNTHSGINRMLYAIIIGILGYMNKKNLERLENKI